MVVFGFVSLFFWGGGTFQFPCLWENFGIFFYL